MTVSIVERLGNKNYRDILCITRHETMTYITIGRGGEDDFRVSSWTPQYRIALSWDLLGCFSRIPRSLTEFITTPEISGPEFYIRSDIYHTQITEYSLKTILDNYSL